MQPAHNAHRHRSSLLLLLLLLLLRRQSSGSPAVVHPRRRHLRRRHLPGFFSSTLAYGGTPHLHSQLSPPTSRSPRSSRATRPVRQIALDVASAACAGGTRSRSVRVGTKHVKCQSSLRLACWTLPFARRNSLQSGAPDNRACWAMRLALLRRPCKAGLYCRSRAKD